MTGRCTAVGVRPSWTCRDTWTAALLGLALTTLFVATVDRGPAQFNDTRSVAVASWSLAATGSPALPAAWPASANYWGVHGRDGRVYVNRFPGVAYLAAPAYAVDSLLRDHPAPAHPFLVDPTPARITSALLAAAAAVAMFGLLRQVCARTTALTAAAVMALGTSLWSVAAAAPWPHAPAMLAVAGTLVAWRTDRPVVAAACGAAAVLVRPHLAVALVLLAAFAAWREGRRPAAGLLAGASSGLVATSAYSAWVFGTWLPVAGYDADAHLGSLARGTPWSTLGELGLALGSPSRGLLVASPVVVVALAALVWGWRRLPGWTRAAAIAGLVILVVQVRTTGHLGGVGLTTYRVSLEALVLAAPAGVLATAAAVRQRRWVLGAVGVLAAASLLVHARAAVEGQIPPDTVSRWEAVDAQVRDVFGDRELGEVDLTLPDGAGTSWHPGDAARAAPEGAGTWSDLAAGAADRVPGRANGDRRPSGAAVGVSGARRPVGDPPAASSCDRWACRRS